MIRIDGSLGEGGGQMLRDPSAASGTNKCRRAFTNWIGSTRRAISS